MGGKMLVHMQFELEHFSVGFYLIITGEKNTNILGCLALRQELSILQ